MADIDPGPEVGTFFYLCFNGLRYNDPSHVEVTLPDGTVRASDERNAFKQWYVLPGDPLGTYRVTARQGDKTASGSFTVGRASTPRLLRVGPPSGPPGSTFSFALAGFPPRAMVPLDLCVTDRALGTCSYLTTLQVQMDDQGTSLHRLKTDPTDPAGTYCLVARQVVAASASDYDCDAGAHTFTVGSR